MARQSTSPVSFTRSTRKDTAVTMSSARAGVVVPAGYIPLLPGDSCAGSVGIDVQLKEMPKPLLNAVHVNVQAWFVPKSAHPKYSGRDELMHAFTGKKIKSLGQADRDPPTYYDVLSASQMNTFRASALCKTLGLHVNGTHAVNTDLIDALALVYNFRLAAHSSRLPRRRYATEQVAESTSFPPAFWPSSRLSRVVPDYERALIVGALDLDVAAGRLPISGIARIASSSANQLANRANTVELKGNERKNVTYPNSSDLGADGGAFAMRVKQAGGAGPYLPDIYAEMGGETVSITLADFDSARKTQAFAKMRTSYAGNDTTGFDNDDTLVAHLMQGISVPEDQFKRPWLLDSARVPVGFAERFATDAANLDQSVTLGRASARLSLNVPVQDVGGVIVFTIEVLPERVDERMSDEWLLIDHVNDLPNALRDVQRTEPVDMVRNRRVDAAHTQPNALYGYEPMNDVWNRDFTRLGGDFYMATPGGGWTENRSNIWQTEIVDPVFSSTHYLAPSPFPHDVFADANADAFEFVCRHTVAINGLTQFGDVLAESNDDYQAVATAGL